MQSFSPIQDIEFYKPNTEASIVEPKEAKFSIFSPKYSRFSTNEEVSKQNLLKSDPLLHKNNHNNHTCTTVQFDGESNV